MSESIISVQNLSKVFGNYTAVKDLSFEVKAGEIFAFLGGNGSGKTTTIRCLLHIYKPTKGECLVYGKPFNFEMSKMLGYLPEERGLYVNARVLETLIYFGRLKGLSHMDAKQKAQEYLEDVGLADKATVDIKRLSSGQQQKIQLGVALINTPELLILDEPTKGLDPVNRKLLMDKLMYLNQQGSTVVFITHQMEEVEKIADRLVMIKQGKRMLYGSVDEVKQQFGTNTIHLTYEGSIPDREDLYTYTINKHLAEVTPVNQVTPTQILKVLLDANVQIREFKIESPSLEEIFVTVSQEDYESA